MSEIAIVPNLAVTDMPASLAFYRDRLGFEVVFMISAEREMLPPDGTAACVFASLKRGGAELMLQTTASLADDLGTRAMPPAGGAGTIYLRGLSPDAALDRLAPDCIVKGPLLQWYGMRELYVRDPDGHILCLGVPEGPPPA